MSINWPIIGAIVGMPFIIWRTDFSPSFNVSAFVSSWIFEWKIEWNPAYFSNESQCSTAPKRKRRHIIKRCLIFGLGVIIFSTILTSALYQNLQVDIKGRPVKIKDVLAEFFKPQEIVFFYQQLSSVLRQLWAFYLKYGFKGIWTQIWMTLDSESEKQAFEVE